MVRSEFSRSAQNESVENENKEEYEIRAKKHEKKT